MSGEAIRIGDIYGVAAHPYIRWTVVAVRHDSGASANIVLRSAADPQVERVVALPVLQNPQRFVRLET
jgi:hypothetical protein